MANLLNLNDNGVALEGYDPVSYFSQHPQLGTSKFSSFYQGATYYFANSMPNPTDTFLNMMDFVR